MVFVLVVMGVVLDMEELDVAAAGQDAMDGKGGDERCGRFWIPKCEEFFAGIVWPGHHMGWRHGRTEEGKKCWLATIFFFLTEAKKSRRGLFKEGQQEG